MESKRVVILAGSNLDKALLVERGIMGLQQQVHAGLKPDLYGTTPAGLIAPKDVIQEMHNAPVQLHGAKGGEAPTNNSVRVGAFSSFTRQQRRQLERSQRRTRHSRRQPVTQRTVQAADVQPAGVQVAISHLTAIGARPYATRRRGDEGINTEDGKALSGAVRESQ